MNELRTCDGNAFCSFCLASLSCSKTKPPLKLFLCRSFSAQCEVTNQRIKTFDGVQYQHNIAGKCPYVLVQEHSNDKEGKRVEVRCRLVSIPWVRIIVELHYGIVLGKLSFLSLAITRLRKKLGNRPIVQFEKAPTKFQLQVENGK